MRRPSTFGRQMLVLATLVGCAFLLARGTTALLASELPMRTEHRAPNRQMGRSQSAAQARDQILSSGLFAPETSSVAAIAEPTQKAATACERFVLVAAVVPRSQRAPARALIQLEGKTHLVTSEIEKGQPLLLAAGTRAAQIKVDDTLTCDLSMPGSAIAYTWPKPSLGGPI